MSRYFYICPECGANLDPGEKCTCQESDTDKASGIKDSKKEEEDAGSTIPSIFYKNRTAMAIN